MELIRFRKRRRKLKKSVLAVIIAFLLVMVGVLAWVLYSGGAEATAQTSLISGSREFEAVIVRNERIVSTEEFDGADYFANEGQRVELGEPVMNVYRMGYSREITLSLWRVKQEIYDAQLEVLGEARDVELRGYDESIEQAKARLSAAVMSGNTKLVLEIQNELTGLLEARSEYLRGCTQETETLRGLYRQESEWENAVEDSRISLFAETSGRVSFYFDDYAVALNADKLSTVTSDLITSALKSSRTGRWMGSSRTNAYRIVNTDEWYLVFLTDASEPLRAAEGASYTVEVKGYGSFTGVAEGSFVSGKKVVNVIKIESDMGELIHVRAVSVKLGYEASGICLDRRAVQYDDNREPYVEVITAEGRVGVYVNILADDGERVIVSARNTDNAPIVSGVKYWIPKRR